MVVWAEGVASFSTDLYEMRSGIVRSAIPYEPFISRAVTGIFYVPYFPC